MFCLLFSQKAAPLSSENVGLPYNRPSEYLTISAQVRKLLDPHGKELHFPPIDLICSLEHERAK
jgi:hypothetical protein